LQGSVSSSNVFLSGQSPSGQPPPTATGNMNARGKSQVKRSI
jgi:hypothetical protein